MFEWGRGRSEGGGPCSAESISDETTDPADTDPAAERAAFTSELEASTDAELVGTVEQLAGLMTVVHAHLLEAIRVLGTRSVHEQDGCRDVASWLIQSLSLSSATARSWVKVGTALSSLPELSKLYGSGKISFDQLEPIIRIANAGNDADLARELPGYSAAEAVALSRRAKKVDPNDDKNAHRRRYLHLKDIGNQCTRLSGLLPSADAEIVRTALSRRAEQFGPDPETKIYEPFGARMADALVDLAGQAIGEDSDPDRADVVVHVDASVLFGDAEGCGETGSGSFISAEAVRRLACDCRMQWMYHDERTGSIDLGRMSRFPSTAMYRYLRQRDGGCRFPGCGAARITHAHHIRWWIKDGATDRSNLAVLCRQCHRKVHEGGWRIEGDAEGDLTFISPLGKRITKRRAPFGDEVRKRFFPLGNDPP